MKLFDTIMQTGPGNNLFDFYREQGPKEFDVTPLRTLVLVLLHAPKPIEVGSKGVVLPSGAQINPCTGVVEAVGTEVTEYKIGDNVLFPHQLGIPYEMGIGVNQRSYRIIHEFDILGSFTTD